MLYMELKYSICCFVVFCAACFQLGIKQSKKNDLYVGYNIFFKYNSIMKIIN